MASYIDFMYYASMIAFSTLPRVQLNVIFWPHVICVIIIASFQLNFISSMPFDSLILIFFLLSANICRFVCFSYLWSALSSFNCLHCQTNSQIFSHSWLHFVCISFTFRTFCYIPRKSFECLKIFKCQQTSNAN